jgi:glutamine synthetase
LPRSETARSRAPFGAAVWAEDAGSEPSLPAGRLERWIGRPPHDWSVDDLVAVVLERSIPLVALMHVGGDGWLKTLDFVPRSRAHLVDVLEGGERADGSSLFPGLGITAGASDVVLRPRIETAFVDPFSPLPTLALLCGHAGRDGGPLPQSPDTLVRRAAERLARETGVTLHALGEIEYFLGRRPDEADVYGSDDRGYHATAPFVFGEGLRRRAIAILAAIGVPVKYGHAEVGYVGPDEGSGTIWEQHEIELGLSPLPAAADAVVLTQWVLRRLAHEQGMQVSVEPVLKRGHAGTGLHVHCSAVVRGEHAPARLPDGRLSDPARWLIGGLVRHGAALMAFGNRVDSSFVRIGQALEAPDTVTWGEFDRRALVRIPILATHPDGRAVSPPTIEFRLPDGSAHPHLLLAGIAQAMVAGRSMPALDPLLDETQASRARADGGGAPVPGSFRSVAAALREHRGAFEAGGVFPAATIDALLGRLER